MRTLSALPVALAAALWTAPAAAQNRAESQMLLELRTLHEQVQKLQLALNQIAEQLRNAEARLDVQTADLRKGFADQKVLIDTLSGGLRTLNEREADASVRIAQLGQEMKAVRDGLSMQQTMLNEIVGLLQPVAAAVSGLEPPPGAPPGGAAGAAPRPGGAIPPSPAAYYSAAFGYYYNTQFDLAIDALSEALRRFPDAPEAARAQLTIGDCYFQMGKRFEEALTAYTAVITTYKDQDVVPDAYYKQGLTYEQLGQIDAARRSYEQVIKQYENSAAAILATQALRRLKIIKDT